VLSDSFAVTEALHNDALVPVDSDDPSAGATISLRRAMARFSHGAEHASRRAAVKSAIDRLDSTDVQQLAYQRTTARLSGSPVELIDGIARIVPTEVLATTLDPQLGHAIAVLIADVERIVSVIGRGERATRESDGATRRLLARFEGHRSGPVEVISMLCQNFDATKFMIATFVHAAAQGTPDSPVAPVARTRRVAATATEAAGQHYAAGVELSLEIGAANLPFGAGIHECPGRSTAEAIVRGVTRAIADAGYVCDLDTVTCDADGRPTHLVIHLPTTR
jgi:cytochrome P450